MSAIKEQHRYPFPLRQTTAAIRTSAVVMEEERENPSYWRFAGRSAIGTLDSYEENFKSFGRDLLHPTGRGFLQRFLEERTATEQPIFYLDLAGGNGEAMRDLKKSHLITLGLTVNLTDLRTAEKKEFDMQNNLCLVSGDLLKRESWDSIDSWLKIQSQKFDKEAHFDLITAWPGGAYNFNPDKYYKHIKHGSPPPAEAYAVLLKRAINRLTHQNGLLLVQTPASLYQTPSDNRVKWAMVRAFKQFLTTFKKQHPDLSIHYKENLHDWNWPDPEIPPPPRIWGCGILKVQKNASDQFII